MQSKQLGACYFISDDFYKQFNKGSSLMPNNIDGSQKRGRPCMLIFRDGDDPRIGWFVPLSSQIEKYKAVYQKKVAKRGKCDEIVFGKFLGHEQAFLVQNIFPATVGYITDEYKTKGGILARISGNIQAEIEKKSRRSLAKVKRGIPAVWSRPYEIYEELERQMSVWNVTSETNASEGSTISAAARAMVAGAAPERPIGVGGTQNTKKNVNIND